MTRDFEGRLDVTLDVLTNDPRFAASSYVPKGIAAVTVRARVVKAFEFESGFPILTPAKIAPAGNPNEEAVVFSTDSRPFELRPTDTPTGDLTLDVSPVSPDRTRWRIRARIPLGARGPFPRIVRIPVVSSNPEAPKELYVTLTGSVR
jgi:hypothetical protein